MSWRIRRKFISLKDALEFYKREYLGIDTDIRGCQIYFTESAFPHLIDLSYQGEKNATALPKGFYVPITCYPVAEYYLKKIKSTVLLWSKSGV